MTDGHGGGFADPIILPVSITIPDPRPRVHRGMSRLKPAVNHPANGWADERPGFEWSAERILGFATELFGAPAARAQEEVPEEEAEEGRRGPGGRELEPAEALRLSQYNDAMRRLRALEPGHRALQTLTGPDYVPSEAAVRAVQHALEAAEARARRASEPAGDRSAGADRITAPIDVPVDDRLRPLMPSALSLELPEARSFSPEQAAAAFDNIVEPNGLPRGEQFKKGRSYSDPHVRTVTRAEYESIRAQLEQLPARKISRPGYTGTWYDLGDGRGFGFRDN